MINGTTDYAEFLKTKVLRPESIGFEPRGLSHVLFPFQADITRWALRKGRAAIFADTGLGKTLMEAEWAREVSEPVSYTHLDVYKRQHCLQRTRRGRRGR